MGLAKAPLGQVLRAAPSELPSRGPARRGASSSSSSFPTRLSLAGTAVLRSAEPLQLGQWHRVTAERLNKDGTLQVDDQRPVKRSSPGKSQGLNLRTALYLGGVEGSLRLPPAANVSSHFYGCLGEVSP